MKPQAAVRASPRKNPPRLRAATHPGAARGAARLTTLSALITITAPAGCAKSGPTLGYGLPSPPAAVYEIADSVEVHIDAPGGGREVAGGYSLALEVFFEMVPGGMRVRAIAESFEGSLSDTIGDIGHLDGTTEFVANPGASSKSRHFPDYTAPPPGNFRPPVWRTTSSPACPATH